ncbi:MAG: SusC/RagA family TonB-linked outer membrane protein [Chitinophagaceae bacterium]
MHKTQKKAALLQSTATVYTDQLITTPAPSFLQALPGRLSGLYTRQRSGVQDTDDPISVIDFSIRGQIPLILIDGVPRNFSSIEPESIESITVLKDALSNVMYGQRSSSNIIYVTTKRAVATPFKLSATVQHGVQSLLNMPKGVSAADYAILFNEARNNDKQAPAYTAADIIAYRDGSDPVGHPNNNYRDLFLKKNANIDRYNVNIQSGNEIAKFYVALDYQKEGGFFNTNNANPYSTNTSVDRYIVRSNTSIDLNSTLNVALNIFGRIQNANEPGGTTSSIFSAINNTPNNAYSVINQNGSLGGNSKYSNNLSGLINNSGYYKGTSRDLSSDIEITQKLNAVLPGLWVKGNYSYNNTVDQTVNRNKGFAVFNLQNPGSTTPLYTQIGTNGNQGNTLTINARRTYTYGKFSLGYDKEFGNNNLNVVLLADRQATTVNLLLPAAYSNIATNLSFNNRQKYFAELAVSYGGFNRFKPGRRFGLFYAGGLGWDLSKEKFMKDIKWINTLKPRISFGRTGNSNVGYYVYDQYYSYGGTAAVYYFGASPTTARSYSELILANPNATWEKADKLNIGLDMAMFGNRLRLTTEFFNDTYDDLMQVRGTSTQLIGQSYPAENIGKNRFSGFENNISWHGKAGAVNYFLSGNISVLKSKVIYQDEIYRLYDYQKRTGLPVGQDIGYIANGFYQSQADINASPRVDGYTPVPGDIKYKDLNGDGTINQFDETAIGTQKPLTYFGLTTGFNFGGFNLTISVQGVANRDIILNGDTREYEFQSSGNNQAYYHHLNRWTPSNAANATYPRLSIGSNSNNQRNSTFWVRSADYLRLQNVDIGYTLPASITNKIKLNGIRIFANGFNLYSFSKLDHNDPENTGSIFPLRRTYNAGLNIKL